MDAAARVVAACATRRFCPVVIQHPHKIYCQAERTMSNESRPSSVFVTALSTDKWHPVQGWTNACKAPVALQPPALGRSPGDNPHDCYCDCGTISWLGGAQSARLLLHNLTYIKKNGIHPGLNSLDPFDCCCII
jgi:hypothetical protein